MKTFLKYRVDLFTGLISLGFLIKWIDKISRDGKEYLFHAAGDIEAYINAAARVFVEKGFWQTRGLAVYPGYPVITPIQKLKVNFVYAHKFPGPEYVLALIYKIFGVSETVFQWARLFPLFTFLASVLFAAYQVSRIAFSELPWARFWIAVFFLFVPASHHWCLQLGGHSYFFSLFFLTVGLSCRLINQSVDQPVDKKINRLSVREWAIGILLGIVCMYTFMSMCLVYTVTPIVVSLLFAKNKNQDHRSFFFSIAIGIGLIIAFLMRFTQLALYLESFSLAVQSQTSIAKYRMFGGEANSVEMGTIQLIGFYSNHVHAFFRIGSLQMFCSGVFVIWLLSIQRKFKARYLFALTVSISSAYFWVFLMKSYSIIHTHYHPRTFILEYSVWFFLLLILAQEKKLNRK